MSLTRTCSGAYVTTNDGAKTTTCIVSVKATTVPVTGVNLNKSSLSMTVGDIETLTATVLPSNATDKSVTWTSSKTLVATVSSSGIVTAKAVGTTTITVTTNDGAKTAICTVTVKAATVSVTGVSLNKSSLSMTVGDTETLTATVTPTNATDKSVYWSSSNTSVAAVSTSGVVTAKAAGTTTIMVTTNDGGKKATCSVTVQAKEIAVTGVSLDKTSLSMTEGEAYTLTATVSPANATNKSVTWTSSSNSVVTVSSTGVVTAKAAGTATITVTTVDGAKTATCAVTVKAAPVAVTGVSLNKSYLSMSVGDTETLTATVLPSNATDKSVTWSSNNTSVATVSSTGVVTANEIGVATITVTTTDRLKTAICEITVIETNIQFEDPYVKAICVQNWDTNEDGELSYEEAAAVRSVESVFYNNQAILTFKEFKYFTGVTSLTNAFYGCKNLFRIELPNSIESISKTGTNSKPRGALSHTGITELTIPASVTRIDEFAIQNTKLRKIRFEEGSKLERINGDSSSNADAFHNSSYLEEFDASNCLQLQYIGYWVFFDSNSSFKDASDKCVFLFGAKKPSEVGGSGTFYGASIGNWVLKVPANALSSYSIAIGWKNFQTVFPM